MSTHPIKPAAIPRTAFEYQDLVGIELLINFYRESELYQWVKLEAEDNGYLDDIVARRGDGSLELIQVKFTVDPERFPLSWGWLLESRPKGTSLLAKWATSLSAAIGSGDVHSTRLRTNRRPDATFAAALDGKIIRFDQLPAETRQAVETVLGGEYPARAFFERFEFEHSERKIDRLEAHLRALLVPTDTDAHGWLLLRAQARTWATRRCQPEPDGRIRHQHLVQIITKKRPQPIPQNFQVPEIYRVPSQSFHDAFVGRVRQGRQAVSVLWGSPGRGKSTYLSFLVDQLRKESIPVIRHHYFLSLHDATPDRISFSDITASLMDQMVTRYPDAIEACEDDSTKIRQWITSCGKFFRKEGKPFVIVIDGLDHVWREQGSVQQMNHLFNYILPCPENVIVIVGTQRVTDAHLPRRLVQQATTDDWLEIPPMDRRAVHEWVRGQYEAGRVRVRPMAGGPEQQHEELGRIGQALFDISEGQPLHLIYSFEALVRRGVFASDEEIRLLPSCPEGDIRKYYSGLWQRLSPTARQALHLVAGAEFHWPEDGLRQCAGPIDEIDHLLEHCRSGLVPFHGSILAYARDLPEHDATFRSLLSKTNEWLAKDAPELWRWGWQWIMQARSGEVQNLLQETTRDWVVASLVQGWSRSQMIRILSEAESIAFERNDYCRTIELRMLKTRLDNGPKYQCSRYPEFEETAMRHHRNVRQLQLMADRLTSLSEEEIVTLSRSASEDRSDIRADCKAEMVRRVNLWITLRHRPPREFGPLAERLFEALALDGDFDNPSVVRFIGASSDSKKELLALLGYLTRDRRLGALEKMHASMIGPEKQKWRELTQTAIVRVASLEGVELKDRIQEFVEPVSPLLACYLKFHKAERQPRAAPMVVDVGLIKDRYTYGRVPSLEEFFHDVFFTTLACRLAGSDPDNWEIQLSPKGGAEWLIEVARLLQRTASKIACGELQLSFATPFYVAQSLEAVNDKRFGDTESIQYQAFRHALRQIAIDLHCLKAPAGRRCLVSAEELATARKSAHWSEEMWLADQVERGFLLLDSNAAATSVEAQAAKEAKSVTVFNERADRWIELARYALLYGLPQTADMLRRAAECILGYGWRKDLWLSEVIAAIVEIHRNGAGDALALLRLLVPIVEQITEFTDGDETDHLRSDLIDAVAEISPSHLPAFYAHHIHQDEFRYAAESLEAHCRIADFKAVSGRAFAATLLEHRDVAVLSALAREGKAGAVEAERRQINFLGGLAPTRSLDTKSEESMTGGEDLPDIAKFEPTELDKLIEAMSDQDTDFGLRRQVLQRWPQYWKERGKGVRALAAARAYFEKLDTPHIADDMLDELFDVSLALEGPDAAYPWLVSAHIQERGWSRYWTSHDKTLRRLRHAAKHYGKKWQSFVHDTSKPSRYWQRRGHSFTIGTENLVFFLLLCEQNELAFQFVRTCVAIVQQEVRDQPIPQCSWFH